MNEAYITGTGAFPVRVDSNVDVPAAVYEHALICEFALARLCQLRDSAARPALSAAGRSELA